MISAFGVDHGGISKADDDQHNRRMRNLTAGIGGTSTALGAATGGLGVAEHKGKDPMGFTTPNTYKAREASKFARKRILGQASRAHGKQALVAGGVGAAGLAAAGGYQHKLKLNRRSAKPVSKADTKTGTRRFGATDAAGAAASAGAVGSGAATANILGSHAHHHAHYLRQDKKDIAAHLSGAKKMPAAKLAHLQRQSAVSRRVVRVKGAGTAAGVGLVGAGGYGLYQTGKQAMKRNQT